MLADCVQDRCRRAVELAGDPPRDLVHAAVAHRRQATRAAKNVFALGVVDLAEVGPARDLLAVRRKEPLDAADEKPDAAFAVGEDEAPRGQTLSPPALDRLAGDV